MDDIVKFERSMEHAWKYFELHAQQRMTVFNFFLAISGLVAAGIGVGLQQGGKFSALVSLLGCFLSLVAFIFWKLDQRVSLIIKHAEATLCYLEGVGLSSEVSIFTKERNSAAALGNESVWTYGKCFRLSFLAVGLIGVAFVVTPYFVSFACKS